MQSCLGYWTDNGAFYYYNTLGENISYEQTLLELHKHFNDTRHQIDKNYYDFSEIEKNGKRERGRCRIR
jgi:hypothetical protein